MTKILLNAILYLIAGIILLQPNQAQAPRNQFADEAYHQFKDQLGYDPTLVNGRYFVDFSTHDLGHPYLNDRTFQEGWLELNSTKYHNYGLMYNVYEQTLAVQYSDNNEEPFAFIPPNELIESFCIKDDTFYHYNVQNAISGFYKIIYKNNKTQCLAGFSKNRTESHHNTGYRAFKYTDLHKTFYLLIDGKDLVALNSKKGFIALYPEEHKLMIKKYIKEKKIKFKKASDDAVRALVSYCENL